MLLRVFVFGLVVAVVAAASGCTNKKKPDFVKQCFIKKKDVFPNCSRASVQGIFDKLKDGYSEAHIIPLDPLTISEIRILEGEEGPVSVNATLRNASITGFGKVEILSNTVDPKTYSFTTVMHLPEMRIEGMYTLRGRILVIPLSGHGKAWFEPRNMTITTLHDVTVIEKKCEKYFNITDVHVDFKLGGLKLRMYNLYNGQKALEESTNAYINANWKSLAESMKPVLSRTIEDILLVIVRQLFSSVPALHFIGDVE